MDMLIYGTGIYEGTSAPDQETCFLTERHCVHDLLKGLEGPCLCGKLSNAWRCSSVLQVLCLSALFLSKLWTITWMYFSPVHVHTIIGERAKRARHSQVCSIENRIYIIYILWYVQFLFL